MGFILGDGDLLGREKTEPKSVLLSKKKKRAVSGKQTIITEVSGGKVQKASSSSSQASVVLPWRLPPASNLSLRRERGRERPGQHHGVEGDTMQWYLVAALLTVLTSSQAIPVFPVPSSCFKADLSREAA